LQVVAALEELVGSGRPVVGIGKVVRLDVHMTELVGGDEAGGDEAGGPCDEVGALVITAEVGAGLPDVGVEAGIQTEPPQASPIPQQADTPLNTH